MIDKVLNVLEKGIDCPPEHKQWYLVQALKLFYDSWRINMDEEFEYIVKEVNNEKRRNEV